MVNLKAKSKTNIINANMLVIFIIVVMVQFLYKNFILFHTISEIFSAFIVLFAAVTGINGKNTERESIFDFFSFSLGFMGIFNLLHIFTYSGISTIDYNNINISMQYSLCTDFIAISSFVITHICIKKNIAKIDIITIIYDSIIFILFFSISILKIFPNCYKKGKGFTSFRQYALVFCVLISLYLVYLFIRDKKNIDKDIFYYSFFSILLFSLYLILTIFNDNTSIRYNSIIHLIKMTAFFLFYKISVVTNLDRSYKAFYYKIEESNVRLKEEKFQLTKLNEELIRQIEKCRVMENKLLVSEKKYKEFLDFLPDGVVAHQEGKIVYINDAAQKMSKVIGKADVIGKNIIDFIEYQAIDEVGCNIYNDNKYKEFRAVEQKFKNVNGEIIDIEVSATNAMLDNNRVSLVVLRDISNRKKALQREKLLNEKIEHEKVRSEFFANVSHEFRTPINVIYGALQVINLNIQDEKIIDKTGNLDKYIKSIKQNCFRLIRLVNNLIDSTKIDAGYFQLHMRNYNIVEIIENITISVVEFAKSRGIDITFDTDVEEKVIACDPNLIERVILNLISNAIKFTPENGKIEVIIMDKHCFLQIEVKDNGIGIPAEKLETVFERFCQTNKSLSREREGSGIGLSLVKSIVEMQGGTIEVMSELEKGSTFIIKFPVFLVKEKNDTKEYCIQDNKIEKINIEFSDIYS